MKKLAPLFALAILGLSLALVGCNKGDDASATSTPAAGDAATKTDAKSATPPAAGDTK